MLSKNIWKHVFQDIHSERKIKRIIQKWIPREDTCLYFFSDSIDEKSTKAVHLATQRKRPLMILKALKEEGVSMNIKNTVCS